MRTFGLEEARNHVPFLLETFARVRAWLEQARTLSMKVDSGELPPEEASQAKQVIDRLAEKCRVELMKLEDAGIMVKGVDGLVDFPATYEGRTVYLCWKYPEETIHQWHEVDTGFAGRQPIMDEDAFAQSFVS